MLSSRGNTPPTPRREPTAQVHFEHYGWCKGTITGKVVDRRRTINKEAINFIAEFDIDDGASTDLSLDVSEYDPSPSADYQSWLLPAAGGGGLICRGRGRRGRSNRPSS